MENMKKNSYDRLRMYHEKLNSKYNEYQYKENENEYIINNGIQILKDSNKKPIILCSKPKDMVDLAFCEYLEDKYETYVVFITDPDYQEKERKKVERQQRYHYILDKLIDTRKNANISQQELSDIMGVSKNYISSMERHFNRASAETFIAYIDALGVPISSILEETNEEQPKISTELFSLINKLDEEQQNKIASIIKILYFK